MGTRAIANRIRKIKELEAEIEKLNKEVEKLKEEVKQEMETQGLNEIEAGDFKVRWTVVTTNRFDSKGFKAVMPELYSKFVKTTESRRFSIA